jgi:hypothetical protein
MKALSIRQPWAWAIAAGHKRVENRTWPTSFRGPIAIHAPARILHDQFDRCEALAGRHVPDYLATSAVVAVATLVNVVRMSDDPWFTGPWGWVLRDVTPIPPVECIGRQGLFNLPPDVEVVVRAVMLRLPV